MPQLGTLAARLKEEKPGGSPAGLGLRSPADTEVTSELRDLQASLSVACVTDVSGDTQRRGRLSGSARRDNSLASPDLELPKMDPARRIAATPSVPSNEHASMRSSARLDRRSSMRSSQPGSRKTSRNSEADGASYPRESSVASSATGLSNLLPLGAGLLIGSPRADPSGGPRGPRVGLPPQRTMGGRIPSRSICTPDLGAREGFQRSPSHRSAKPGGADTQIASPRALRAVGFAVSGMLSTHSHAPSDRGVLHAEQPSVTDRSVHELPESSRQLLKELQQIQQEEYLLPSSPQALPLRRDRSRLSNWTTDVVEPWGREPSGFPSPGSPIVEEDGFGAPDRSMSNLIRSSSQAPSLRRRSTRAHSTGTATSSPGRAAASTCGGRRQRRAARRALQNNYFKLFLAVITFHLLFSNDLYYMILPKEADTPVLWVTLATAVILLVEIALNAVAWRRGYLASAFFWLDAIAWGSTIPDCLVLFGVIDPGEEGPNLALARVGRCARIGARLGRLGRLTKHVERCYNCFRDSGDGVKDFEERHHDQVQGQRESTVGLLVKQRLTSKNSVFMLVVLFGGIILSTGYSTGSSPPEVGLRMLLEHEPRGAAAGAALRALDEALGGDLLIVEVGQQELFRRGDPESEREVDVMCWHEAVPRVGRHGRICVLQKGANFLAAALSVTLTVFALCLVVYHNAVVVQDIQNHLLAPVERMVSLVDVLVVNPLAKFNWGVNEETGEMGHLIRAIKKLGALIQVGFGEAGAEVVSKNLQHGALFTMLPGRNVLALFSFCDIRKFTQATEVLRQDVMFFVNSVARIVHATVHECGGSPNKNIGDAFLSVWRLGDAAFIGEGEGEEEDQVEQNGGGEETEGKSTITDAMSHASRVGMDETPPLRRHSTRHTMRTTDDPPAAVPVFTSDYSAQEKQTQAENALAWTLLANERIHSDPIVQRITSKISDSYKCNLGHGLHYGWAVEGAIGSELKIDASYLSPHVNVAARLEAATKQYGTPVLISAEFHALLSPYTQQHYTRPVDCVMLKGTQHPRVIYSAAPLDPAQLPVRLSFQVENESELAEEAARRTFRRSSMHTGGDDASDLDKTTSAAFGGQTPRHGKDGTEEDEEPEPGVNCPVSALLPPLPVDGFTPCGTMSSQGLSVGQFPLPRLGTVQPPSGAGLGPRNLVSDSGNASLFDSQTLGDKLASELCGEEPAPELWPRSHATHTVNLSLARASSLAIQHFIIGDFNKAGELLSAIQTHWPGDAPSAVLLSYLSTHRFKAPADWPGYRVLTDK
eukprot:TRINITY_DN50220_c0_g1_i1.p1 TRINITY_DN50220_c0_g1~~TRINITY_DN50220_c0_g1_i1.p1  ORF type:complete len:1305 (+),score=386.06 TRINITY_DN50220_c0_g1_i1:83-3916(+)